MLMSVHMGFHFSVEAIEELVEAAICANRRYQDFAHADLLEAGEVVGKLARRRHDSLHVAAGLRPSIRKSYIDAMTDRESFERFSGARHNFLDPCEPLRDLLGLHPRAMPSVAEFNRAPACALTDAADPDRNVPRRRPWSEAH